MTRSFRNLVVLLLLCAVGTALAAPAESSITDARRQLADQIEAWNRGDLPAFCSLYAEDALFVSPSGITQGRDAVLTRYQKRYPDRAAMGTLSIEIREVRSHADGQIVALAGIWTLSYSDREPLQGQTLVILEKGPGGWRIAHDASM